MTDAGPVISISQLSFGYTPKVKVIDGCDAMLQPGRVTALVGPNAAGKTTLMRLMLGLLQPWSGVVHVGERDVGELTASERARLISYVPQRPGVRFAFTVRQVIAMGAHALRHEEGTAVDAVLERAGLRDIANRVFTELSGGQQQRALLARAELQASQGGRAMLLDEPGSHLDLSHRHAMMRRLRGLAADGLAVLIVLHDLDLAARFADDAWLMDSGRLVSMGPWHAVLTPEKLCPVYAVGFKRVDVGGDRPLLAVVDEHDATMTMS